MSHRDLGVLKEDFERFEKHVLTAGDGKATINQYRHVLEELASLNKKPKDITPKDLKILEGEMRKRLPPSTIKS
jgi:DnaJ-domain-containing protein 1